MGAHGSAPVGTTDYLEDRLRTALSPNLLLVRSIGAGGMARVFLAREPALKRLVAVKVLSGDYASSKEGRARFEREAQAVAGLSHPNIVAIHTVGELDDHTPYFVMQYVEGRSLAARVESDGPLAVAETRRVLGEVAAALATAHQQGIIHRDIKPANILYEEATGRSLVSDFGIAAIGPSAAPASMRLTGTGVLIGTPQYMSPEQLLAEPMSEKTDIYSLGLLAHELLIGSSPFRASSPHELIAAHLRDTPQRLAQRRADVDAELDELIARCLEKDATKRPTAADVARRLAPGGAALLEWPAPGLEELHGKLRSLATMQWLGGGLVAAAMVIALLFGPRLGVAFASPASLLLLLAVMAGVLVLVVAIRRTVRIGAGASRAIRAGYAWMTVLETLADRRGDTGNIITGSREYAALQPPERDRFRKGRVVSESLLLAGGFVIVPLLIAIVMLGSSGYVSSAAIWVAIALPLAAALAASWVTWRERRAFAQLRRRKSTAMQTDVTKLSAPWNESFESVRTGQAVGRGARGAVNAGWLSALGLSALTVAVLIMMVPLAIVGTLGPTLWSIMWPKFGSMSDKVFISRVARPYQVTKDPRVSPLDAGRAYYALLAAGGLKQRTLFPELPAPQPALPAPPWSDSMPAGLFLTARQQVRWAGVPAVPAIMAAVRRGFTPAEMAYLEQIAHAPHWRAFESIARANDIDYWGARYQLPFPDDAGGAYNLPIPRVDLTKQLAYASVSRAAYYLARGQRDSAETSLRLTIAFGFVLTDHGNTLIEQLIGIVIAGIGRSGLIEYYKAVGDPRGGLLQAKQDSAVALIESRAELKRDDEFASMDLRDTGAMRTAMRRLARDTAALRGLRMEMFSLMALAPCTNARELVFGPDADVRESFAQGRKSWARFAADTALLDLIYRTPDILGRAVRPGNEKQKLLLLAARAGSAVLRNPRLVGCTVGILFNVQ
jgi:hypothetical protein